MPAQSNMLPATTRCDLHLHSDASLTTGQWFSQYFGAAESYADPVRQYELCKSRGMTLVTLTDHDSIDGGLRLIDKPDFFLSVEVSTRFPENDCAIHVLVWNLTEEQHVELQRLRDNIYDVSSYLRQEGLAHGLPHPLLSPNWRLDAETLEKCLVLFPAFEATNGLLDRRVNPEVTHLFEAVTPGVLAALAQKHGIELPRGLPAHAALTAGSDDHGHRRAGTIYTEVEGNLDAAGFLRRVMAGEARVVGEAGDLDAMAMCIKQSTYEYFRRKPGSEGGRRNPFVDLMDLLAGRPPQPTRDTPRGASSLLDGLLRAAQRARVPMGLDLDIDHIPEQACASSDRQIVEAVGRVSDALVGQAINDLAGAAIAFDVYGFFAALTDLAGGLVVASPQLFAADHFARQQVQARRIWTDWTATERPRCSEHLAVFSDSLDKVDGVATWCSRFTEAAAKSGRRVWFAACDKPGTTYDPNRFPRPLPAIARFALPIYPGFEITVPSLAATVDRMWREGITHVEVATPGPMGLVGVAAARILRLPVTASYHTDLPDLVHALTGEAKVAELTRAYLRWFYRIVDRVFVFSEASRDKLLGIGVAPGSIEMMPVAVDPEDFSPKHQSRTAFSELGLNIGERPVVLSVGRLSAEKNVSLIVEAVENLQGRKNAPFLVVVGDGPARAELERRCRGKRFVAFLGFQQGRVLRELYASARAFVFASTVDTLGLVNLEALASGVPVLVPSGSAIADSLCNGTNALFFQPDAAGLAQTLRGLLDDPAGAASLAENGRRHMLARWEVAQFDEVWRTMIRGPSSRAAA